MQSIDHLVDAVALYITQRKKSPGNFWFSKIDLKYAYSQIPLDNSIAKHCNFSILGGQATGTYRFLNGFYGLTDMPATFQKTIDKTLDGINSKFAFLDDILVITKGSIREHELELDKILNRLNNEGLAINLQKCEFAKNVIEWLGFTITPSGITPLITKTEAITKFDNPKTLKQLRSFLGSVHHLTKFIPNLAKLSEPLRPLLKKNPDAKNNKLDWNDEHSIAFNNIKAKIHQIIENKHFDTTKQTRVKCDASAKGLGACIEQKHDNEWHTIAFASRFLNKQESRYSTNELELLAVVWSLEHFKHYLFGTEFTLQTDHRALLTALNENRGNKTYQSRLTRWVDRLLPFNFNLEHIPGKSMGFADYLSRHPKNNPPPPSSDDTQYIVNLINDFKFVLTQNSMNYNSANCTDKYQTRQATRINSKHAREYNNAFCLNRSNYQQLISPLPNSNNSNTFNTLNSTQKFHSNLAKNPQGLTHKIPPIHLSHPKNSVEIPQGYQTVNVTTRNKPQVNTFDQTIIKRKRAPNKTKMNSNKVTIATQTDNENNKGLGRSVIIPDPQNPIYPLSNCTDMPQYRKNLNQVFGEEFVAEATAKDRQMAPIIKLIKDKDWDTLKRVSPYFYSLKRDLSITPSGCVLYDNRLMIPSSLKQLVINSLHQTHPGQAGMLRLADLVWFPRIHREVTAKAQSCGDCIKKGKNLKPLTPKNSLGILPKLSEPNEEVQLDFAGPIPFREHKQNYYILVSVDRLTRYPHAEVFKDCDTQTALNYLEEYCRFHGIPRSIRCDQAQAFKAREFEIFCKNKNIKLILAPAGDHRATGMVERLIQTIKRRIAVMEHDPLWSSADLATIVAKIIESIRLIPNATTKIKPFVAHFGRPPNTELSNIITKPSNKNLSYKQINKYASDQATLQHPALPREIMWDWDHDSEPELDIQYKTHSQPHPANSDTDDSENAPLLSHKRVHGKIIPDRLEITFGDKTSTVIYNRKNIARKTLARKVPEPRGTLKPQWNIIPDGTITNYSPHTITLDTDNRKNTVIRRNDLAIVTETKPREPEPEPKPRLIHMVACKTVGEYKRNQEKIRKFCLEEKTALAKQQELIAKQQRKASLQQTATQQNQPGPSRSAIDTQPMGHADIVAMAKRNQQAQKRQRATKKATSKPPQKQQRQQAPRNKSPWNPQRPQWLKNAKTRLTKPSLASTFELKSKAAALQQSREAKSKPERKLLYSSSSESKSFISVNKNKLKFSPTVKIHNIQSESPGTKHFEIITSSDPQDFMMESNDPTNQQQTSSPYSPPSRKLPQGIMKSTPKWDKLVEKIWSQPNHESTGLEMSSKEDFPIQPPIKKVEVVYLDPTTSEIANTADTTIITISEDNSENIMDEPATEPASVNDHPNDHHVQNTNDTNDTNDIATTTPANDEEHKSPSTSPAKSSISSLHTSDFFNPEEF